MPFNWSSPLDIERKVMKRLCEFLKSEDGPAAVEYAVMLALIVVVCMSTISAVGTKVNSRMSASKAALP